MHLFQLKYLLYLALNGAALFFLFASIMGIPGNPDPDNKKEQMILDLWGKLLIVAYKGIPILATIAFVAFLFHFENTGKIISYVNVTFGFSMIVLVAIYWKLKS
jgi:hypothetical protein